MDKFELTLVINGGEEKIMQHYGLTCLTGSMFSCDCHHKYEGTVAMLCRLTAFSIVKICSTVL